MLPIIDVPTDDPPAPRRARGHGDPAAGRAGGDGPVPRRARTGSRLRSNSCKRRRDELRARGDSSPAAAIARRIGRTLPLIHGGGAIGAVAAQRWKTQVNENAKAPAFWSAQPELCHNEVCGWGQHGDVTRQVVTAIALRHDGEHPQVGRRFDLVGELLREVVADVIEVRAGGDGDLAQLLDLILFGDYVSLWMAVQAGIDPGPVPVLVEIKARAQRALRSARARAREPILAISLRSYPALSGEGGTRSSQAARGGPAGSSGSVVRPAILGRRASAGLWLKVDASRRRNDPRKATVVADHGAA